MRVLVAVKIDGICVVVVMIEVYGWWLRHKVLEGVEYKVLIRVKGVI